MGLDPIQALFFDFDGVILNSNPVKTDAFRTLFRDYDEAIVAKVVQHHHQLGGISRVEKIEHAHRHFIGKPLTAAQLEARAVAYSDLVVEQVIASDWIPGSEAFLKKQHRRMTLFVISGTPDSELKHIVRKRNMDPYFKEILGSPTKKPDHIRALIDRYGLAPSRCFFIGDALTDFLAARETGLNFIGVQGEAPLPAGTTVLPDCTRLEETLNDHCRRFSQRENGMS